MSTPHNEIKIQQPETLGLDELQVESFESMFRDLEEYARRGQKLAQSAQDLQNSINQNNADWNGTAKAIQVFIKTIVKHGAYLGDYVYDREKKCLVLKQ